MLNSTEFPLFYRYKHFYQILISTIKDEIKAKIHFTRPWLRFRIFSGFGKFTCSDSRVNVWTLKPDRFYDLDTHTHTTSRKSQTKRLLLADVEFLGYTLRNCFFFFFPRKELNVIQQLKDDKFTDWILKIRKRILHAASLCTHRNITKSEANIENS